jgi:hypothetical protein
MSAELETYDERVSVLIVHSAMAFDAFLQAVERFDTEFEPDSIRHAQEFFRDTYAIYDEVLAMTPPPERTAIHVEIAPLLQKFAMTTNALYQFLETRDQDEVNAVSEEIEACLSEVRRIGAMFDETA